MKFASKYLVEAAHGETLLAERYADTKRDALKVARALREEHQGKRGATVTCAVPDQDAFASWTYTRGRGWVAS